MRQTRSKQGIFVKWRARDTRLSNILFLHQNLNLYTNDYLATVKHGGGSIMLWGEIS